MIKSFVRLVDKDKTRADKFINRLTNLFVAEIAASDLESPFIKEVDDKYLLRKSVKIYWYKPASVQDLENLLLIDDILKDLEITPDHKYQMESGKALFICIMELN